MNWDELFMGMAELVAQKSKDEGTKCGCVLVGPDNEVRSVGYNGIPRGIEYKDEYQERPEKYYWFEHAERNAVYNAARFGAPLVGCKAYVTNQLCHDCVRALIQAGIIEIIMPSKCTLNGTHWNESVERAFKMLDLANIKYRFI